MATKSGGDRNREHNARGTPEGRGGGGARGNADRGRSDRGGRDSSNVQKSQAPNIDSIISGEGFPSSPPAGGPSITRTKKGVQDLFSHDKGYNDPYNTGLMGPTVTTQEDQALQGLSPEDIQDYLSGKYSWDKRPAIDGWDILDYLTGPFIDLAGPTPLDANTYQNGNWHTYSNPGGILGLAAGAASGIPGLGMIGSYGWRQAGLPMAYHNDIFGTSSQTPQTAANPDAPAGAGMAPDPVAQSRSPLNNRIGGYSGGGYNMGAFGKKSTKKTNYLTQQLMAP